MKWCARFLEVIEEMAWVAMSVEEISRHFCASSTILSPSCEKEKRKNSLELAVYSSHSCSIVVTFSPLSDSSTRQVATVSATLSQGQCISIASTYDRFSISRS